MAPAAVRLAGESGEPLPDLSWRVKPLRWEIALSVLTSWKPGRVLESCFLRIRRLTSTSVAW